MRGIMVVLMAILAIAAAYTLPTDEQIKAQFVKFAHKYEKTTYGAEEFGKRFQIFKDNVLRIELYNQLYKDDIMTINKFADLTPEEFRARYLMPKKTAAQMRAEVKATPAEYYNPKNAPSEIDWVKLGAVTPVKNQGSCGSWYVY
jgi:C1A family cysteine protease